MLLARRLKYLILGALVVSLGLGAGFSILRGHLLKRPELLLEEAARRVDLTLKDIDYTQIKDGRKQWSLKATQVEYEQAKETFRLKDVFVTVYRPQGKTALIQGEVGYYNRSEGWVRLEGRAHLATSEGYQLKAETFLYRLESQELTSPDPVNLSGPGVRVSGKGLRMDVAESRAVIFENVASEWTKVENKGA